MDSEQTKDGRVAEAGAGTRSCRLGRLRLALEAAKIDAAEEQAMAEEFRTEPWPDYCVDEAP
jgi:hypothetical protein